jgi:hypothetical protein
MSRPYPRPTQPPIQWLSLVLPLRVKGTGGEADVSYLSIAGVLNEWRCISNPPACVNGTLWDRLALCVYGNSRLLQSLETG